jgi:hypothetical protein
MTRPTFDRAVAVLQFIGEVSIVILCLLALFIGAGVLQ